MDSGSLPWRDKMPVHHFSMRVLVSDTSILIDLKRADLPRAAFSLDAEFVVPDLLYERELRDNRASVRRSRTCVD